MTLRFLPKILTRFRRSEAGGVTVEAALWLPFWILVTFGIGEVALVFNGQARVLEVAQNATRSLAVGDFTSEAEVADYIKATLKPVSSDIDVRAFYNDGLYTTVVDIPANHLGGGIGIFSTFAKFDLQIVTQQTREF